MGIDELRIGVTLMSFITFIAIMVWAWSRRNKARFDEAAMLPFTDDSEGSQP
ncbi:MAG TPA: CcoQ/FixQ family Cbb3-type cytochrome c oxidase assembly chaperone [Caldimonas sp.]|nr:CcoQ/FixQ family Cbb3-type cytochrome c oxidase assembly chaperone [Caldimonas sp.]